MYNMRGTLVTWLGQSTSSCFFLTNTISEFCWVVKSLKCKVLGRNIQHTTLMTDLFELFLVTKIYNLVFVKNKLFVSIPFEWLTLTCDMISNKNMLRFREIICIKLFLQKLLVFSLSQTCTTNDLVSLPPNHVGRREGEEGVRTQKLFEFSLEGIVACFSSYKFHNLKVLSLEILSKNWQMFALAKPHDKHENSITLKQSLIKERMVRVCNTNW